METRCCCRMQHENSGLKARFWSGSLLGSESFIVLLFCSSNCDLCRKHECLSQCGSIQAETISILSSSVDKMIIILKTTRVLNGAEVHDDLQTVQEKKPQRIHKCSLKKPIPTKGQTSGSLSGSEQSAAQASHTRRLSRSEQSLQSRTLPRILHSFCPTDRPPHQWKWHISGGLSPLQLQNPSPQKAEPASEASAWGKAKRSHKPHKFSSWRSKSHPDFDSFAAPQSDLCRG